MRARVLVVDDDEVYLAGIKELLEGAVLQDNAPDLMIIDVRLGAFNGLQLISTGEVRIPAVVVTGFDDPVLRADAQGFGASYLVKPVSPPALLSLIEAKLASVGATASAGLDDSPALRSEM